MVMDRRENEQIYIFRVFRVFRGLKENLCAF